MLDPSRQLFYAGSASEIEELIRAGANPNATHAGGASVLSVYLHDPAIVRMLLLYGASASVRDSIGRPYLHLVTSPAVAQVLLTVGHADPEMTDGRGDTALLHHCFHSSMSRFLLTHGANPNAQDVHGRTILHRLLHAINPTSPDDLTLCLEGPVALALDCQADPYLPDSDGTTPYHLLYQLSLSFPMPPPALTDLLATLAARNRAVLDRQIPASVEPSSPSPPPVRL